MAIISDTLTKAEWSQSLDLLSTSQKKEKTDWRKNVSPELVSDAEFMLEQSHAVQAEFCENNAPFIFFIDNTSKPRIVQGCCNSWGCPRCAQIRARQEYGRIVEGARQLTEDGHTLYFHTLTCRGSDCSLEDAQENYLKWTNRLLSACRARAKKQEMLWAYVQVTERQKRLHPHSHLISTFCPDDAQKTLKTTKSGDLREVLVSQWFVKRNVSAGLGWQCEITEVRNPAAVAVYVAKYLFKDAMLTVWPKGWKRVRYSQSWPKVVHEFESPVAFPLVKLADWHRMENLGVTVYADSEHTLKAAYARLIGCVVYRPEGNEQ